MARRIRRNAAGNSSKADQNKPTYTSTKLGDEVEGSTEVNKRTGRPVRKSAGRKTLDPSFVSKTTLTDDESDSDAESTMFQEVDEGIQSLKLSRKRARSPSRAPLSPPPTDAFAQQQLAVSPAHTEDLIAPEKELSFTFNVPPGHSGPFVVKFDLAALIGRPVASLQRQPTRSHPVSFTSGNDNPDGRARKKQKIAIPKHKGFLDLPAELRNIIYRLVFVDKKKIHLGHPNNFQHSASLLRTCHQVYEEGREILYGENHFQFERSSKRRGHLWEDDWSEVGWKDVRNFLTMIGPTNVSLLRDVHLECYDASYGNTRDLTTDERRLVNDEHLIQSFKILAQHGRLERLVVHLHPRKAITRQDYRFVDNLSALQADDVDVVCANYGRYHYFGWRRVPRPYENEKMESYLTSKMTRKEKMYQ